jgi:hypothetical protein
MPVRRGLAFIALPVLAAVLFASVPAAADDPTKEDCVAANENAQDLQGAGKLVAARSQLLTCAARACPRAVRQDCTDRLHDVEKELPTIVLTPRDARGGRVNGATLAIDGAPRPEALDGTPLFVDPGQHTFTVSAPGRSPASVRLSLNQGDRARADAVFRAPLSAVAGRSSTPEEAPAGGPRATNEPSPGSSTSSSHPYIRWIAWSAIGAGVVGLAFGSVAGLVALHDHSKVAGACPDPDIKCPPNSGADIARMDVNAVVSDLGFSVGVLGIGAGAALLLLYPEGGQRRADDKAPDRGEHPSAVQVRPWIGLGNAGMSGTFR